MLSDGNFKNLQSQFQFLLSAVQFIGVVLGPTGVRGVFQPRVIFFYCFHIFPHVHVRVCRVRSTLGSAQDSRVFVYASGIFPSIVSGFEKRAKVHARK